MVSLDWRGHLFCIILLTSRSFGLDEVQYGWLTPLNGDISPVCRKDSLAYASAIEELISNNLNTNGSFWALQMLDSDGKIPMEGSLADTFHLPIDLCQLVKIDSCLSWPVSLRQIQLLVPVGYAHNPGSYESCLGVALPDFSGKYCPLMLNGPPSLTQLIPGGFGRAANHQALRLVDSMSKVNELVQRHPVLVPNLENYALLLSTYKYMLQQLRNEDFTERATLNETVFSMLEPDKIRDYIMALAVDEPQPIAPDPNTLYKNILLALLAIYSAFNRPVVGLCIPSSCSENDVAINYIAMFENLSQPLSVNITPYAMTYQCYTDDNRTAVPDPLPPVDKFIIIVFVLIGICLIGGTTLDLWDQLSNGQTPVKQRNILVKSLLTFSAYTNGLHLLSTSPAGGKDHLDCMNGMRFLSMTWVVLGHSFFVQLLSFSAIRNTLLVPEIIGGSAGLAFEAILNALPSVDSFFLMSGTLTAYLMFRELEQADRNILKHTITFVMYYVHRYLRLTITYALVMGVIVVVVPNVFYGPGWLAVNVEAQACRTNWWAHFLYVNTLLKSMTATGDNIDMCMGVSWYLVDDMIFHWFSPLVLYPMFLLWQRYGHRHTVAILYWVAVMASFTSGLAYIAYSTQQPPQQMIEGENYHTNYTYHVDFYNLPWARYQPYLVGILLGYILHHTRGQKVVIHEQLNILLWQAAFLTGFAVVYGLYDARVTLTGSLLAATFYNTFQRLAWPLALSWVIFACVKGYGGLVNDFLSWSVFGVLSRLTYCSYLFHISVLNIFAASVLSTFANDFSMWANVWFYLGSQVITLAAAFVLSLCFESPFIRLEKLWVGALLARFIEPAPIKKNGVVHEQTTVKILDEIIERLEREGVQKGATFAPESEANYAVDSETITKEECQDDYVEMAKDDPEKESDHDHEIDHATDEKEKKQADGYGHENKQAENEEQAQEHDQKEQESEAIGNHAHVRGGSSEDTDVTTEATANLNGENVDSDLPDYAVLTAAAEVHIPTTGLPAYDDAAPLEK